MSLTELFLLLKMAFKRETFCLTGMSSSTIFRPSSVSQEDLLELIDRLNKDRNISGLLVQLPLPGTALLFWIGCWFAEFACWRLCHSLSGHINERAICNAVAPEKDVDGFHIVNIGKLCLDQKCMIPATAAAVWEIIRRTGQSFQRICWLHKMVPVIFWDSIYGFITLFGKRVFGWQIWECFR